MQSSLVEIVVLPYNCKRLFSGALILLFSWLTHVLRFVL